MPFSSAFESWRFLRHTDDYNFLVEVDNAWCSSNLYDVKPAKTQTPNAPLLNTLYCSQCILDPDSHTSSFILLHYRSRSATAGDLVVIHLTVVEASPSS